MFAMFDCCILQYIKNICCRFNLETMTFIFDLNIFNHPRNICFSHLLPSLLIGLAYSCSARLTRLICSLFPRSARLPA
jgi:hypothetical protein